MTTSIQQDLGSFRLLSGKVNVAVHIHTHTHTTHTAHIPLSSKRLHTAAIVTVVVSASVFRVFSMLETNRKRFILEREWEREKERLRLWLNW